jgi:hypothetical protein
LPAGLSPHGLRHTYASILVAVGKDPVSVMVQLGHTDSGFSLRVYSHMMRRDLGERESACGRWSRAGHAPSTDLGLVGMGLGPLCASRWASSGC